MKIEDFFNMESELGDTIKMTNEQFISKTRDFLTKIEAEYSHCWGTRRIRDEEYELADCDNCKGECNLNVNGKEINCVVDNIEGECFTIEFDSELFAEEIENIMFHDDKFSFYELLQCEISNEA